MSSVDSDAETVLGESPLSPCMWTQSLDSTSIQQKQISTSASAEAPVSSQRRPHGDLQLSPASQLDVLSQISELANAQPSPVGAPPVASRTRGQPHVWAVRSAGQKRSASRGGSLPSCTTSKAKKLKTKTPRRQKKKLPTQAEQLAVDMLEWETCSETGLFDADDENWVYEDISDSDFEQW